MHLKYNKTNFNVSQFEKSIGILADKIAGYKHEQNNLIVYLSKVLSGEEKEQLDQAIIDHLPEQEYALRIYRVVSEEYDHDYIKSQVDFSLLGFRKMSPSYDRGKKTRALYKCINKDEIIVEKVFNDVRNQKGILSALSVTFNWYDENNEIALTKTEEVKQYNIFEAETEERKRRYRQFDYLRASVKGTPHEPYIAALINHYQWQIDAYKNDGLYTLNTDMLNETDPMINAILNAPVARNDGLGATTVLKSIQYQIGTITIEEL